MSRGKIWWKGTRLVGNVRAKLETWHQCYSQLVVSIGGFSCNLWLVFVWFVLSRVISKKRWEKLWCVVKYYFMKRNYLEKLKANHLMNLLLRLERLIYIFKFPIWVEFSECLLEATTQEIVNKIHDLVMGKRRLRCMRISVPGLENKKHFNL